MTTASPTAPASETVPASAPRGRILLLDYSHVYNNPRVIVQGATLVKLGYAVHLIGVIRIGVEKTRDTLEGMPVSIAPFVVSRRPLDLLRALGRWLRGDARNVQPLPDQFRRGNVISLFFFNLWVVRLGWRGPVDAIHCHDHLPLPAAWLLKWRHRVPLVFDVPEYMGIHARAGLRGRIAIAWQKLTLPRADAVLTVGERLAATLRELGARRALVIGNWKRLDDYNLDPARLEAERARLGLTKGRLTIIYIGYFLEHRDLRPLLAAVEAAPDVTLLIGGDGDPPLREAVVAAAARAANIIHLGWVNLPDVPAYTHLSDVIYHCIDPQKYPQVPYATPNKLFEAFAAGKAMIVRRGLGEMSEILERTQSAVLLDEVTPATIQAAFRQLQTGDTLARMQANALAARAQYNAAVAEARLGDLYAELIPPR